MAYHPMKDEDEEGYDRRVVREMIEHESHSESNRKGKRSEAIGLL